MIEMAHPANAVMSGYCVKDHCRTRRLVGDAPTMSGVEKSPPGQ